MKEFISVIPFEYFAFQLVALSLPTSSSSQAALPYDVDGGGGMGGVGL